MIAETGRKLPVTLVAIAKMVAETMPAKMVEVVRGDMALPIVVMVVVVVGMAEVVAAKHPRAVIVKAPAEAGTKCAVMPPRASTAAATGGGIDVGEYEAEKADGSDSKRCPRNHRVLRFQAAEPHYPLSPEQIRPVG